MTKPNEFKKGDKVYEINMRERKVTLKHITGLRYVVTGGYSLLPNDGTTYSGLFRTKQDAETVLKKTLQQWFRERKKSLLASIKDDERRIKRSKQILKEYES
jgi:hypothetical protein